MRKTLALFAAALMLLLTACGGESSGSGAGHSFAYTLVGNPDTLDPQLAENSSARIVLSNLFEGLFVLDDEGNVQNGLVESYTVSDDGLCYTMHLRSDSYWYQAYGEESDFDEEDAVAVTAMDFVFAFQRLFDPVYDSPYREQYRCIRYADKILAGEEDASMIGVYAKKPDELEITLDYPNGGLPLLLTMTPALPCNQQFFESTKGRYGLDEQSIIGNGSFSLTRWLYDPYGKYNTLQLTKNPLNQENHKVYPADLTFYIEESDEAAKSIFENGATDCYVTTQSDPPNSSGSHAEGAYSITLGLLIGEQSQYAEKELRHALSIGLDRDSLHPEGDDVQVAKAILPPAVMLLGKSCRELIAEAPYQHYNLDEAKKSFSAGLEKRDLIELEEERILVPAGLMDYTPLAEVLESWEKALSVYLSIEEVPESEYQSRLESGDYTLALYALTGDSQSAVSVFDNLLADENIQCSGKESVKGLLESAAAAESLDDCIEYYRQAEETILEDECFLPLFYKQRYLICKNGVEDVRFNPFNGLVQFADAKYYQ